MEKLWVKYLDPLVMSSLRALVIANLSPKKLDSLLVMKQQTNGKRLSSRLRN
jgi:hypothetical protein